MKFPTSCLFLVLWTLVSCQSDPESPGFASTTAVLRGMVYNTDRQPVSDVTVSWMMNGKVIKTTQSDLHGRYALPAVAFGPVTLSFDKKNYEPLSWSFSFKVPSQIVYVQMSNLGELLDAIADGIQKRDWAIVRSSIDRVKNLDPSNLVVEFLRSQMQVRQGDPEAAVATLEKIAAQTDSALAVELNLGDLYQYKLNSPEKALVHLKKALLLQDDGDVRARIAELEKH